MPAHANSRIGGLHLALVLAITATAAGQGIPGYQVDIASREETRRLHRTVYASTEGIDHNWTGNYATGNAGTVDAAFLDAVLRRVNYVRALAGVPSDITFAADRSAKAQQSALMMSRNNALSHNPPASWTFYTADGALAAQKGNLAIGTFGPPVVDAYLEDFGTSNRAVGHRIWVLYPHTREMGSGDVPGDGTYSAANTLWVIEDATVFGPRPTTRDPFVAWPPAGHVPYNLVTPRWSLTIAGADFTNASVAMTRNGVAIPASILTRNAPTATETTLVWEYNGLNGDTLSPQPHPRPSGDVTYSVSVTNVLVGGSPTNYAYAVIVFDPGVAGPDAIPATVTGPVSKPPGVAATFQAAAPDAETEDVRVLRLGATPPTQGAEGTLTGVVIDAPGHDGLSTATKFAGARAFHLANVTAPYFTTVTFPGPFLAGDGAALRFRSRLGFATTAQVARVEVSTDDGMSWTEAWSQAGTDGAGEGSFTQRTVSLTAWQGKFVSVRLAYAWTNTLSGYVGEQSTVGWFVDDVEFLGQAAATVVAQGDATSGFAFAPTERGAHRVQARGRYHGGLTYEWGTPAAFTGGDADLANVATRGLASPGAGAQIMGFVITGTGTGRVLIRAVGPKLADFGLGGVLPNPTLSVVQAGVGEVAVNNDWGVQNPGLPTPAEVTAAASAAGAFPLTGAVPGIVYGGSSPVNDTLSAALVVDLPAGVYTAVANDAAAQSGVGIVEVYGVPGEAEGTRFTNLSNRGFVGAGEQVLIPGFVVTGDAPRRYLVRVVGPKLADFGLAPGTLLANPRIELVRAGTPTPLAVNDSWQVQGDGLPNGAEVAAAAAAAGAFPLTGAVPGVVYGGSSPVDDTSSAALVVTLDPGVYTVVAAGADGGTGIALAEIYELD